MRSRIVIVGAGISGLSAAFRLQQRLPDAGITILEQAARPGGTAWTVREAGFQFEIGPNGFLDTKPTTLTLSQDVGLGSQLVQASEAAGKNRFLFLDGRLKALPGGFRSFLWTDLLSWRGKLSLLWERFRGPRTDTGDESIDAFARRRAGNEAADVFADALVTGIYAGDPKLLSLPACFPRVAEMEQEYGSVMKGFAAAARIRKADAKAKGVPVERPNKMWSFPGGMRVLVEAITAQLKQPPVFGVNVRAITKQGQHWRAHGAGADTWDADAVILTCPAYQQAAMLADVDAQIAQSIGAIAYNRIAVVAFGYRQADVPMPLDGFGYIAPQNTRRDLLGVQWCSSIYPGRAPDDCVLLRAMAGGWHRADIVDWDDARLSNALRAELRLAMGITAEPIFHKIVRWDKAIPQYHLGHLERVENIEHRLASHPGLFLGGNAYHGVALNDCTGQGMVLAERVGAYLSLLAA
ncbi:MAG: protoporphyrinogen oxidase [Planctomycetes bacterium]|nr:protoporphyrinogen oxidase [Planctomycetota bacterium]